ncbi:hypothetical protein NLM33_48915 (plasmid) [Bradyrhizobium sp. CCGUVB1N3]|uniref:hypothetical protein n=1 Tax=Bradyrhizobium sp. CCGUVB1N3 TaxID=2949629 RepID=UPI0020B3637E|nr:hypothetical protein [Bradyrhizobium sp. CCGUVB1N3]MCP3477990.1 hypothetical protein [Bradyrhizobium sp. CCGUVB1N3]
MIVANDFAAALVGLTPSRRHSKIVKPRLQHNPAGIHLIFAGRCPNNRGQLSILSWCVSATKSSSSNITFAADHETCADPGRIAVLARFAVRWCVEPAGSTEVGGVAQDEVKGNRDV